MNKKVEITTEYITLGQLKSEGLILVGIDAVKSYIKVILSILKALIMNWYRYVIR